MSEPTRNQKAMAGGLFMAAGVAFIVAAFLSDNTAFYGVSAAMMGVGVVFMVQAKKDRLK